ncbi:Zn-ribbon domain-containing OB-fold protein [Yinghuangia seranimata]|uniref:Zn-ribbon domain-containing OB-fold protein n=1 Tax=Yinghuangia seranimata TaxID=408067 RepID=UPI00248B357F|nr:OB-fold domain-containing protein [Yinghuangia seranimata]MDI2132447.1 OB-fold domain-containing protein [Yinghuangia seranimata]
MTDDMLPPVDDLTAPWWDATRERRLLLQKCGACAAVQHYPRRVCTSCGAVDAHTWVEACGLGTVDSYTVVHRAPAPGVAVPYTVARVRLAEGPLILTRLTGVPDDGTAFDAELELTWLPLADGRHLPAFRACAVPSAGRRGD